MPDALDLMVVSSRPAWDWILRFARVTSGLGGSGPVLCEEFAIANFQLQMGRPEESFVTWGLAPESMTCAWPP